MKNVINDGFKSCFVKLMLLLKFPIRSCLNILKLFNISMMLNKYFFRWFWFDVTTKAQCIVISNSWKEVYPHFFSLTQGLTLSFIRDASLILKSGEKKWKMKTTYLVEFKNSIFCGFEFIWKNLMHPHGHHFTTGLKFWVTLLYIIQPWWPGQLSCQFLIQ